MSDSGNKIYNFKTEDFWIIIEKQKYTCALTGRVLTPLNTELEHRVPLKKGGEHKIENLYMIDHEVSKLAKDLTENEIVELAYEILKYKGNNYGITVKRN